MKHISVASRPRTTRLSRREMLLVSAAAAGASIVAGTTGCAGSNQLPSTSSLPTRSLGPLKVTALGFGAMNAAGTYGPGISRADAIALIRQVFDRGIRFI